jgi:pimeloyl-ACP methyl ester carboxylesterase
MTHWQFTTLKTGIRLLEAVSPRLVGRLAFNLFLTPRPRSAADAEQQVLDTARRIVIYQGDDRLSGYVWDNTGATVLLVHGWESGAGSLTPLVAPLQAQGYRVVAFDAPAHGISHAKHITLVSYAHAIRETIDQYGPAYAVVAHSFGGAATMLAAAEGLEVERVVLIGAPARLADFISTFAKTFALSPRIVQEIYQRVQRKVGKPVTYYSAEELAHRVPQTGLVIHDRRDPIIPFADAEAITTHWRHSRLFATDGLGHRKIRQDTQVIQRILDFLFEQQQAIPLTGD